MRLRAAVFIALLASSLGVGAQQKTSENLPAKTQRSVKTAPPRISLSPRFSPGQVFRYEMEFETTTATSRSGLVTDRGGPSTLEITWDATIRLEVFQDTSAPGRLRLRTTYDKSTADVRSDTVDPAATEAQQQYQKLEGKVVEFTLDAAGKVISVSGLDEVVAGDKALVAAREWIAQLNAGSGAPAGGVMIGQRWTSQQPAASLPVAGLVWRTESQYLRNEVCRQPNPAEGPGPSGAESPESGESCAVILSGLNLVRPKRVRHGTSEEYRKNGVRSAGTWNGSGQSLSYISLRTGLVVSVTQTGSEQMDVTLTTGRQNSLRYIGTIVSRSQVALVADHAHGG